MAEELEKESTLSLGTIILYLEDWYTDHVLGSDREYKEFLSNKMAEDAKVVSREIDEKVAS